MRVPLIRTLDANENASGYKLFPSTDGLAKIKMEEDDGTEIKEFSVDRVECRSFGAKSEIDFCMDGVGTKSWTVSVTKKRIIVWNAASKGLFGKPKEKSGKATGGHLLFESLGWLSTFCGPQGKKILLCVCLRKDQCKSALAISGDEASMKKLLIALHGMADTWITEHNMKLRQEGADEKQNKALEAWENFVDNAWGNATEEESVMLPVKSMKFVANSQMDERR